MRKFCIILAVVLILSTLAVIPIAAADVWDGRTASAYAGGSGTQNDPWQISNGAQLQYFANQVTTSNSYAGKYFILTSDIILNEGDASVWGSAAPKNSFISVGGANQDKDGNAFFAGDFNGNGHTISGLYAVTPGKEYGGVGLFSVVTSGANIHNFVLTNSYIASSEEGNAVGIIAYAKPSSEVGITVDSIYCDESVYIKGVNNTGGIVGQISGSFKTKATLTIKNCVSAGNVSATGTWIGGIFGNGNGGIVEVSNSLFIGSVTGNSFVGGIVGRNDFNTKIESCISAGSINATTTATSGDAAK